MPLQEAAAPAPVAAGLTPHLCNKKWDTLYPPHVLGEVLKEIKRSMQKDETVVSQAPATGDNEEKQQRQQILAQQMKQHHHISVQTQTATPPTQPTQIAEERQAADGEEPLAAPCEQQQQMQTQQQLLPLPLQQLQRHAPVPPEMHRISAREIANATIPIWESSTSSTALPAVAATATAAPAGSGAGDSPCVLAFLPGMSHAYSPTSQGSTAAPQTPQGELGFDAAATAATPAAAAKNSAVKQGGLHQSQQQPLPFLPPQHGDTARSSLEFIEWGRHTANTADPTAVVATAGNTQEYRSQDSNVLQLPNVETQTPCSTSSQCGEVSHGAACVGDEIPAKPSDSSVVAVAGAAGALETAAATPAAAHWQTSWPDDPLDQSLCRSGSLSLSSSLGEPTNLEDSFSTSASAAPATPAARNNKGSIRTSPDGTTFTSTAIRPEVKLCGGAPGDVAVAGGLEESRDWPLPCTTADTAGTALQNRDTATPIVSLTRLDLWQSTDQQEPQEQQQQQPQQLKRQLLCPVESQLASAFTCWGPTDGQHQQLQRQQQERTAFYRELASKQKHLKQHLQLPNRQQSDLPEDSLEIFRSQQDPKQQQQHLEELLLLGHQMHRDSSPCVQQGAVAPRLQQQQEEQHHEQQQGCLCKGRHEPVKQTSVANSAKRASVLLPRLPPSLPPLAPGWERACDRSHLTSLLITLPLNLPFGRILKFGSGDSSTSAVSAEFTNNSSNTSSQSLGVKKSYYIFSPTLHPAAHTLFSHAGGICDTFAASLQMELAIIYVPCLLVPLVAAAFNTLGQQLLPQLHEPLRLRCWGLQERNAPGRFGGKVLTVSCSVEGEEERGKFEKLQTFLRHLENYVEGLLRTYGQQQQTDGKRLRVGENMTASTNTAAATPGRSSCCRRHKGTGQQHTALGKKNNIWRYSMVSTSRSSEQADSLNTSNGGGSSSGCLDLTIRAFETRPLDRPVRDFSGCAVKGICTSEIRLVTTKAIHGMTCEIDPRFRHYSIGTRPILKAPSGALCRHCIAPQLLPEVWEAHLRSGVSAARDQQKKLTETCVIAHIENRPAAKRAALLESLGRLGVPLWVNGKPLTHPAVVATDGESVALPMTGVKEEGAKQADVHMNSQQDHVLHRLSLLSLDTAEERRHQQQQFHLFSDVTEQQQKHHPKQQQHQAKTSRTSRQQQKRGQVARTTQQQHAQQQQALPSQPASTSAYQGQADENVLVAAAAVVNVAPVPQAEPISTPVNAVTSVVGRPSHCQRQRLKERLQPQQQEQLLLLSSPSAKEERLFHLQQQQQQAHGSENDLLRLAQEVWMDARPMQQQHQQLHQLQQLQQLQEMQQIQQQELQHRQHRSVPVELAPLAVGVGSIAPFPTTAGWQQVQHHQRPAFSEATPPGLGLVTGDIQQQQQPPQLRVYGEADCPLPVVASSPLLPDVKGCSPLSQQEQLQKLWTPSSFTETVVQRQADTNLLWGHELTPNVSQQQRQQSQQNAVTLHQQFQRQQGELQQDVYQQSVQRIVGQQQQQGTRLRLAASNSMGLGFQPLLNWEEQQQQQSILIPGADQQQTVPQRQQQQQQQQQEQQQKQPALFLPAVSPNDFLAAGEQQQQGIMQLQRMQWLAIPN